MKRSKSAALGAIGLLLAGAPALAATVVPGDGAQRTFIWHAGSTNVQTIVMTPVYETFANVPPFQLGSLPPFNPNLPAGPTNRPFYTVWVPGVNSSILERIFATMGADAEPGKNPDTGRNDDPAPYAYAGTLADRANPFRGLLPPTRNGLVPGASGQAPRAPVRRSVNIGPPANGGVPYPNDSTSGDTVDPRVSTFFNDPVFGWNGVIPRFPNFIAGLDGSAGRVLGFGGDFDGITPCLTPSVAPNSSAQAQIRGTIHDPGCIPNQNTRATGGAGELPARPAPDRGNLDVSANPGGAAQGVSFAFPPAAVAYERNVDPESGRPRIAGATGRCVTPGAFRGGFGEEISAANPKSYLGMQGGLGMGVDPDCLKAGGAAGGINANQWDPADYQPLLAHYADPVNNPLPVLYDLPGSSPQNALENHRQTSRSVRLHLQRHGGDPASVDRRRVRVVDLRQRAAASRGDLVPLSEVISTLFAGERSVDAQGLFRTIESNTKQAFTAFTPVRNLNVDSNDGMITAFNAFINKGDVLPQPTDWLTMDSTLTNEQRALLGCGPFYGTRCDSGVGRHLRKRRGGAKLPVLRLWLRRRLRCAQHRGQRAHAGMARHVRHERRPGRRRPRDSSSRGRSASSGAPYARARSMARRSSCRGVAACNRSSSIPTLRCGWRPSTTAIAPRRTAACSAQPWSSRPSRGRMRMGRPST